VSTTVARYFGKLSTAYGKGGFYSARRRAVIEAIKPTLERRGRLLDIGCGNGAFTLEFCSKSESTSIFAADLSSEMVDAARRRLDGNPHVRVLRADAAALPFRDAAFDLIFMSNVLPFATDSDQCLEDAIRCISYGGTLVIANSVGGVEAALAKALGTAKWREFDDAVFEPIALGAFETRHKADSARRKSQGGYQQACEDRGLTTEFRMIPYSCGWPELEELVELRWLTLATENQRATAHRLLRQASDTGATASIRFDFQESLLIGSKRG
jgi:ubiquinone/menaquinone biosynthesis C-methylase UbiE